MDGGSTFDFRNVKKHLPSALEIPMSFFVSMKVISSVSSSSIKDMRRGTADFLMHWRRKPSPH